MLTFSKSTPCKPRHPIFLGAMVMITEKTNPTFSFYPFLTNLYKEACLEVFCKKSVLKNFAKFTGKHLCQSLFLNKVAGLGPATLFKKRLWHRCFPVNFMKFLRTPFSIEHWWCIHQNSALGELTKIEPKSDIQLFFPFFQEFHLTTLNIVFQINVIISLELFEI